MARKNHADIFFGFRCKARWVPPANWCPRRQSQVDQVCSICDCLSELPIGWVERWDFNRACCYTDEAAANATLPIASAHQYDLFAYRLVEEKLGPNGDQVAVQTDDFLDPRLPPLPAEPSSGLNGFEPIGYDVVSHEGYLGFGHSPLSCNLLAEETPVNRFCLIDDREEALSLGQRFDQEEPEPAPYFVIQVLRRDPSKATESS